MPRVNDQWVTLALDTRAFQEAIGTTRWRASGGQRLPLEPPAWWQRYAEWHATYGPPGGYVVQVEAMVLALQGIAREIAETVMPGLVALQRDMAAWVASLPGGLRDAQD